ncbi:MAG: histidine phosphatase family protein [Patescibacteria group bacterium]|nr:histidine phosphatase family protein [Patescibacteria group bacterium]
MKKNNFCILYLVRHGRTNWNEKGLIQGHTDISLDSKGKAQALELAKELKHIKFDKVFSSDLLRAKQTAEIIALEHKLIVKTIKALREREFGIFEGKHWTILKEIDDALNQLEESKRFSYKHHTTMESDEELMSRFLTFLREIAIASPGKKILIVTHGGPMRALLTVLGIVGSKRYFVEIRNLAYLKLESDGVDFFVKETKGIDVKPEEIKKV